MKHQFNSIIRIFIVLLVSIFFSANEFGQDRIEGEHASPTLPRNIGSVLSDVTNLVLILPTHESDKAVQDRIQGYAKKVFGSLKESSVLLDEEALKRDLSQFNLVVYGTPKGNCWLEKYLSRMPIKIEPEGIVADKVYTGSNLRLYTVWANPQNADKGIVIYTAPRAEDIEGMDLIPHKLTQFVIAEGQKKLKAGFYKLSDGAWEYPDLPDWQFPVLTKTQMEEDFNTLVRIVKDVMPTVNANRKVFGVDVFKNIESYRAKIAGVRSTAEFIYLLDRAINSCKGNHFMTSRYSAQNWKGTSEFSEWIRKYTQGFVEEGAPVIHEKYRDYLRILNQYHALDLPLLYYKGHHYTRHVFTSGGVTFAKGLKILRVNGQAPDAIWKSLEDASAVFYFDFERKKFFLPDFSRCPTPVGKDGRIHIKFEDKDGKTMEGVFPVDEAVAYQRPKRETSPLVKFLDKTKILYIRLPDMEPEDLAFYKSGILAEGKHPDLRAVVIDIRGNPGGSDSVWATILQYLCDRKIKFQVRDGIKNNALNRSYIVRISNEKEFLEKRKPEKIPFLDNEEFLISSVTASITPAEESLRFSGPIFVLSQDSYSSAASLVSMVEQVDQIISMGVRSTYPSGGVMSPYLFSLPHSKFCFTIVPDIDLTNCRKAEDVYHTTVEVNVTPTLGEWLEYYNASGEIPLEGFLLKFDPFFKKVLEFLEGKKELRD